MPLFLEVNETIGLVFVLFDVVGDHEQGLILVMLEGDYLHGHPATAPSDHRSFLLQILHLLGQKIDVGDVMPLDVANGRSLYVLYPSHEQHPFSQFIEALEIEHALADRLHEVLSLEDVGCCGVLGDCLQIDGPVEDERAEAEDIQRRVSLFGLDIPCQDSLVSAVDVIDAEDVHSAIIDDDQLPLSSFLYA